MDEQEIARRIGRCQGWVTAAEGASALGWKRAGDFRRWALRNGVKANRKQDGTWLFSKGDIAVLMRSL